MDKMIYANIQLPSVLTQSHIICYSKYDKLFKSQGPVHNADKIPLIRPDNLIN